MKNYIMNCLLLSRLAPNKTQDVTALTTVVVPSDIGFYSDAWCCPIECRACLVNLLPVVRPWMQIFGSMYISKNFVFVCVFVFLCLCVCVFLFVCVHTCGTFICTCMWRYVIMCGYFCGMYIQKAIVRWINTWCERLKRIVSLKKYWPGPAQFIIDASSARRASPLS